MYVRMNFLAVGLCIEISTGLLYYYMYMNFHNAWLLKTSSKKKKKNRKQKNEKQNQKQKTKTKQQ